MIDHFKKVPVAPAATAAAVLLFIPLWSTVGTSRAEAAEVLFVTGSLPSGPGDLFVINRLALLGHNVIVVDDDVSQTSDADGNDLVIISNSVRSLSVNNKFTDVPVSVITYENPLYDDLLMTTAQGPPHFIIDDSIRVAHST